MSSPRFTYNVIRRSKFWLAFSSVLMIASLGAIGVFGLNFGIDFTGGSLIELGLEQEADIPAIRSTLGEHGYDATVQDAGEQQIFVRLGTITQEQQEEIISIMEETYGTVDVLRFESVGPVIGQELEKKSSTAMILLSVLIVIYIAWTFRKVSKPIASWKYGLLTLVAAAHDVILPLGVFAVLGHFIGYQVDTAFVAALLTILGYSINDTIVVFDRTRENLMTNRHSDASFDDIVNRSVLQSFARSMNTSLTTLLVLVAIFFFGGETTQPFVLALIIGIVSGAYSSIFVASPLLVVWNARTKS